ncbi:hypothetical protein P168DRAFT_44570 [Aspergillus campestris IBT 28561]|uniref:Uncharacterized protein n=1 Tax=Aspergillus campestris (strain IBT 28561) TaxID=1392248 RepID=A0A2I1CXF5_ASPC2|nr:uncharacterized protein P168DRAFT_44570 [Aspergillus campestris IBT 28561]PKY02300.1 hypothetical protein P168DRAFT_44570 [Aspergillus campestris IBT 28561]
MRGTVDHGVLRHKSCCNSEFLWDRTRYRMNYKEVEDVLFLGKFPPREEVRLVPLPRDGGFCSSAVDSDSLYVYSSSIHQSCYILPRHASSLGLVEISRTSRAGGTLLIVILPSTACETRCETDELIDSDCLTDHAVGPELLRNTRLDGALTPAKLHQPPAPYDLGIVMLQLKAMVVSGGYSSFAPDWKEDWKLDWTTRIYLGWLWVFISWTDHRLESVDDMA